MVNRCFTMIFVWFILQHASFFIITRKVSYILVSYDINMETLAVGTQLILTAYARGLEPISRSLTLPHIPVSYTDATQKLGQ